jgi:hypothetical protein
MLTMTYERIDGSQFEAPIFHPHMEYAALVDPQDGRVKTFETKWRTLTGQRFPIKRVEVPSNG